MKFLRVAGLHYANAKRIPYQADSKLSSMPYQDQLKAFFSYHLHYGDSLTHCLKHYGYSTLEVLYDIEILQKKWAEENGCTYSQENWQSEILIQQIQKFRPEILYLHNVNALPISVIKKRKEIFPFIKCLVLFRGYPEIDKFLLEILAAADILLVGSPVLERICRANHLKPNLFYHYFDERLLAYADRNHLNKSYPLTFLGTSGVGYGWNHQPRYHYVFELLKKTKIECWLEENPVTPTPRWKENIRKFGQVFLSILSNEMLEKLNENCQIPPFFRKCAFNELARKKSLRNGNLISPSIPLSDLFPSQCHEPLFGLEMCKVLAASQITFNKHTLAASGTVDNIRLFEATGVGTCLLTDSGSNLQDLFEIDREVVTYSSLEECQEKIQYLMQNEGHRKSIALNGQKRTLRDHTASQRALQMHELIQKQDRF